LEKIAFLVSKRLKCHFNFCIEVGRAKANAKFILLYSRIYFCDKMHTNYFFDEKDIFFSLILFITDVLF
jgi:hypothetical protein